MNKWLYTLRRAFMATPLLLACTTSHVHTHQKPAAPPPTPLLPIKTDQDAWRTQKPPAGTAGDLAYPVPERDTLSNGLAVLCLHRNTGPEALSIIVKNGAEQTQVGKSGAAALLARLLSESTRKRGAIQLAEATEMLGSTLTSMSQRDSVGLALDTLAADVESGVALLGEAIRDPAWSGSDFERVRTQWLDDLKAERQSPHSLAALVALRALFGAQRGAPVNGSTPDVAALKLPTLHDWYNRLIHPGDTALVAVGPADCDRVRHAAKDTFGSWRPAATTPAPVDYHVSPAPRRVILIDRKDSVQSALFVVQPLAKRLESGHEARVLLNEIIGGLFTSRINQNLREAHAYTYGAHSMMVAHRNFGLFVVQTSVRTDATAPALNELFNEIDALSKSPIAKPIVAAELERARADAVNRLGAHLESNRLIARDLETLFVQGLGDSYYSKFVQTFSAVNLDALTHESQRLDSHSMLVVIVGDRAAIEEQIVAAGYQVVPPDPAWLE